MLKIGITAINQKSVYNNTAIVSVNNSDAANRETPPKKGASYDKVSISSEGRQLFQSSFERSLQIDKTSFERGQSADKAANDRELANKKKTFKHQQAEEERQFNNTQNLKEIKYLREIAQDS